MKKNTTENNNGFQLLNRRTTAEGAEYWVPLQFCGAPNIEAATAAFKRMLGEQVKVGGKFAPFKVVQVL